MNDLENRLRQAVRADGDNVRPDEFASLDSIRTRARTARNRRRAVVSTLGAALVVVAGALALPRLGDDNDKVDSTPVATDGTNPQPTTPNTTPTPTSNDLVEPGTDYTQVLWPDPDAAGIDDPAAAARGFLDDVVGADNPISAFRGTEPSTGEIDVYGVDENGDKRDKVVSTIVLRQYARGWYVWYARSDEIDIDTPLPDSTVSSPLLIAGRGRGYEGNIVASIHERFVQADEPLAREASIAGCCEELLPFNATLEFERPDDNLGMLFVNNDSGIAAIESFVAIPIRFGAANDQTSFAVYFHVDEELVAFARSVPKTTAVLRAALSSLLAGPTAKDNEQGAGSFFSAETADMLLDVKLTDGVAVVSLDPTMPDVLNNASTSAGSEALLAELDATVFQFGSIQHVEYHLGDSCEDFGAWLQRDTCESDRH